MVGILSGIFLILHGLVHFWYVVLSFNLVPYQPDMGWTGKSWLFPKIIPESTAKTMAGILFIIAALLFIASGIAVLTKMTSIRTLLVLSSAYSTAILFIFWDGKTDMLVQKGILGVLINVIILFLTMSY